VLFSTWSKVPLLCSTGKPEQAPKKIKLFVNRPTIGFGEAADLAGQHEFELTEKELGGEPVQLK